MRGKLPSGCGSAVSVRITPADAGKTFASVLVEPLGWDHPRGCGENVQAEQAAPYDIGSPPRMRGKLCLRSWRRCYKRITPADAGKTRTAESIHISAEDHPRGCGENLSFLFPHVMLTGSPPRMRGKQAGGATRLKAYRITPADAGKTLHSRTGQAVYMDHPRGCGENVSALFSRRRPTRITPADAGKTANCWQNSKASRDHPRGCGENESQPSALPASPGSPPRMRGKLQIVN